MVNSRDVPSSVGHLQGFVLAWSHSLPLSACDKLFPLFCKSYTSNTLPLSTFCAWCEICKCSPFAETLPDWQRDTFVASRWVWHISPLLTIFLTQRRCLLGDVKLRARSSTSWSVSQLVKPAAWSESERNNISSSPIQDSSNAARSLMNSGPASMTTVLPGGVRLLWYSHRSLQRLLSNLIWQILSHCFFF